ncbi:nitrile hydratase accessory protein [Phyllobacterium sp. SB3]|uniref:nitrile hydratase accessory protein n=1 Tax=Phyllobacterium sp. SB3 TaxID=3156073 RepID=UPI0032B02320
MNLRDLINVPTDLAGEPPVFAEPWQAEAFAIVVALHAQGLFTWEEWARALSSQLKQPEAMEDASDYYRCWLAALESLITEKNITPKADIDLLAEAWQRAALATPHGQPIRLENDPHRV